VEVDDILMIVGDPQGILVEQFRSLAQSTYELLLLH